jgi:hypothetical protein
MTPTFRSVQTYTDLLQANIAFLEGQLLQSPYHLGPIDEETVPLLPKLTQLNRLGFLTVNSQPARNDVKFVQRTQTWSATRQLAFLEWYMPKAWLPSFRTFMDPYETKCVYYVYQVTDQQRWCCFFKRHSRPFLRYREGTAEPEMCVTWDKAHPDLECLDRVSWRCYTWFYQSSNDYDFARCPWVDEILVDHTVKISLICTDPEEDLEQLMLTFVMMNQ